MDNCPKCKSSWLGDKIPEDQLYWIDTDGVKQPAYTGTHWKREIGIDGGYIGIYDGTVAYRCPDCDEEFPISQHPIHLNWFKRYKDLKNG